MNQSGSDRTGYVHNDTSGYIRNVLFDAAGAVFIDKTMNATRQSSSVPHTNLTGSPQSLLNEEGEREVSDYWLPSLAPLGSVSSRMFNSTDCLPLD